MRLATILGAGLIALMATVGLSTNASAASGTIRFTVFKAGFIFGGSGGSGVLRFRGRDYPITIGGISYGFTFGASQTRFRGRVTNIRRASDVAGVYGAAGAGAAVLKGAQGIVLTNQNGAVLTLAGEQTGLIVSADLNGMAVSMGR
jgi:lipid-binding SYLF domain-containing protein